MNINNNTEISSLIANSISKLNLKTNTQKPQEIKTAKQEQETTKQEDVALLQNNTKTNQIDVAEIREYASMVGEELSIEDINYGLMYGRSVIADYSA